MGYEGHTIRLGSGDLDVPPGTTAGDVLVLVGARTGAGSPTPPENGWTSRGSEQSASFAADARVDIWTLLVTGTPPDAVPIGNVARAALIRLSGVHHDPVDVGFATPGDTSQGSVALPEIDTVEGATKIAVLVRNNQNADPGGWNYPDGFAGMFGVGDTEEDRIHFAAASRTSDHDGPSSTPTFGSISGGRLVAAYLAFAPDDSEPADPASLSATRVGATPDVTLTWAAPTMPDATHIDIHRRTPPTGAVFDPADEGTRIDRVPAVEPHEYLDLDAPASAAEYQVFAVQVPDQA